MCKATNLKIIKSETPKEKTAKEKLVFGRTFTDHMIQVEWNRSEGWKDPLIKPYGPLSLNPSASVFHYAIEVIHISYCLLLYSTSVCTLSVLRD